MKRYFVYTLFLLGFLTIFSCGSSKNAADYLKVQSLLSSGDFSFMAERANPTNMDVINVMNSFPNMGSSRMLTLDPGYSVDFTSTKVTANLPYFGRMFTANMDPTKNGYNFKSEKFSVDHSKSTSKKTVLVYNVQDLQNVQQIFLEIYPNGRAFLSINSNDRQAISYDGFITDLQASGK